MSPRDVITSVAFAGLTSVLCAQADLAYLRSLHPNEADVRTYIERAYTNILINPVSEAAFDAVRAKAAGQTFIDPNFGREWTLMTTLGAKILNSERNGWNSDNSLISLTVQATTNYYDFALFDGAAAAYIRTVRFTKPFTNITQLRWMPNDPSKMFYFHGNKMYTFDVNTAAVAEYQTFASFTSTTTDIAGGDGNDVAPNGDLLVGNKGPDCFVYNIPLKKVVRLSGGVRTYLDPTQSFPTINLGQIDYAFTFNNKIIEQDEDSGGTLLRDLNGNVLQTIYKRTPHLDPSYFNSGGVLYPGFHVVYNAADATHYNNLGLPSVAGGGYFHAWDEANPTQLIRFTMDEWTATTLASGGMYSANRYGGTTGIKSLDGPMLNSLPWQARTGENFEHSYAAGEATMPRRFAHHYIGYTTTYTTSYQPEGWISPNGDFAIIKVAQWGWYKVKLPARMTKAEVDNYLNGVSNTAPTISETSNLTIDEDTSTGALAFTVGDAETAAGSLTVSSTSSNQVVVPNGNIVFGGSGANRTVTVTPAANQSGSATIFVTVSDSSIGATDEFVVTVTAVNDAPTVSDVSNMTINEDASTSALAFTVGDVETAAGSLTVSSTSSNQAVVPNGNIVLGGNGANRSVTVTPAANQSGSATIVVTVSDGSLSATDEFVVTVTAVNDAPTISDVSDQAILMGGATGALGFTVGDVETTAGSLTVSGTSSNQTLVPNGNIVFGGSGASRSVTVTPVSGQSGSATITVTVSDGTDSSSDTFVVNVSGLALPFSDDFEDNNPAPWVAVIGTWDIVADGSKVYRQTNTTGDAFSTIGSGWGDQVVQARMKILSFNGTNRHVSLYARFADPNNHYYMAVRSNNTIELKKKVGGTVTTLQVVPFTVVTGTWYDLMLGVVGSSLTGYVNGVPVVDATDIDLVSGSAAFGMFNASAVFDDVEITPTLPPVVLVAEDFEDSVAGGFSTSGGSWSIVTDGSKTYEQGSTAAADAWSLHSSSWTDQVVEVSVKPLAFNGTNRPVSVYARFTDSNNHYYVALRSNNTIELKKKVGGTVTTLQSTGLTVSTGAWYDVRLEAVGTTLKAYVNGNLLLTATDSDLASGTVAVGSYAASARFDDLLVTDRP